MTRAELAAQLAILVARRALSAADADRLLALYDDGTLTPADLPAMQPPAGDDKDWLYALLLLLLLLGGNTTKPLAMSKRKRARKLLRLRFEQDATGLAAALLSGALTLGAWQAQTFAAVSQYARTMTVAGAGTLPATATIATVQTQLAAQWPYLTTFGTNIVAKQALGTPLSAGAIARRTTLYGGTGWGAWFRANEADRGGDGYVCEYIAVDDGRTCGPCLDAAQSGPYLPNEGPFPGMVCAAAGACRCERRLVFDLDAWQRLTGRA